VAKVDEKARWAVTDLRKTLYVMLFSLLLLTQRWLRGSLSKCNRLFPVYSRLAELEAQPIFLQTLTCDIHVLCIILLVTALHSKSARRGKEEVVDARLYPVVFKPPHMVIQSLVADSPDLASGVEHASCLLKPKSTHPYFLQRSTC